MTSLLKELEELTREQKRKKEQLQVVVKSIKEEMSDHYFKWTSKLDTFFRFALMLVVGKYQKDYYFTAVSNYRLTKAEGFKERNYRNYFYIERGYHPTFSGYDKWETVGFVCYKKDLFNAFEHKMEDMWRERVANSKYKGSLEEFINSHKDNPAVLIILLQCLDPKSFITIVNYPSLKIKDVVIYIKQ